MRYAFNEVSARHGPFSVASIGLYINMTTNSININDYANCMFRFETMPQEWLDSCAVYIKKQFGNLIENKVVLDYAFGRGNWSLAFLKAGAKKVISVDASYDNVDRFKQYCNKAQISNIEILHGNILKADLDIKADFLWIYGILPMMSKDKDLPLFLERLKLLAYPNALFYMYYYNSGSLREFIVENCRKLTLYESESDFLADSPLFIRTARQRARDDLTSPYVGFLSASSFQNILHKAGFNVIRQDIDFQEFLKGVPTQEFYPHQFLCALTPTPSIQVSDKHPDFNKEFLILNLLANELLSWPLNSEEKRKIAIGLFNTLFAWCPDSMEPKTVLPEIFLYLIQLTLSHPKASKCDGPVKSYQELSLAASRGEPRQRYISELGSNLFTDFLCSNRIRL